MYNQAMADVWLTTAGIKCLDVYKVQATLLNTDMCSPDFRLNRTDWKVPASSNTYNSYTHNPDFA